VCLPVAINDNSWNHKTTVSAGRIVSCAVSKNQFSRLQLAPTLAYMPAVKRRGVAFEQPPEHLTRPGAGIRAITANHGLSAALHHGKLTVWGSFDRGDSFRGEREVALDAVDIAVSDTGVVALLSNGRVTALDYAYESRVVMVPELVAGTRVTSIASCSK
jgi:hypothetical protein